MITSWDIYWITRLDSVHTSVALFIALLGCALFAFLGFGACDKGNFFYYKKSLIATAFIFVMSIISITFIPSTKEACAIYLIPKIANNEQMQKLPDNAAKLLNVKMEEWINDTLKEKEDTK